MSEGDWEKGVKREKEKEGERKEKERRDCLVRGFRGSHHICHD